MESGSRVKVNGGIGNRAARPQSGHAVSIAFPKLSRASESSSAMPPLTSIDP
jgi:hypothetical protein